METLFDRILIARGLNGSLGQSFLSPDYSNLNDPYLLPDINKAINRLSEALKKQEKITIYGDYDIDGITSVVVLFESLKKFGFKNVDIFMPNRFIEGYGLTSDAIEVISSRGTDLIVTVDCGSSSIKEIDLANRLGVDIIVTDHHNILSPDLPSAVAFINPKRQDSKYPFNELAGVGVVFKLVQALQSEFDGLPVGQEKWLLDMVALGTVCDVVPLTDENRIIAHFGLKVLSKTKRVGLKSLMKISGVDSEGHIKARTLGFVLGPRMNAAGRLDTAQYAIDMLIAEDLIVATEKAEHLDRLNNIRRAEQDKILKEAIKQIDKNFGEDNVIVVSSKNWNHGILGIVASKLLEKYKKPIFILQEMGDESKGSARSYGDFNAADALKYCNDIITKGGGHSLAAGLTIPTKNITKFRECINSFYEQQNLVDQESLLLPKCDALAEICDIDDNVIEQISKMEPFGNGNPEPIIKTDNLIVKNVRKMGSDNQHIRLKAQDAKGDSMDFIAFNAPSVFFVNIGDKVNIWHQPVVNEWRGIRSIEGRLVHLELSQ